jgi:hypothetical protein
MHALAMREHAPSRIGVRRAPTARTARAHGDSAAAHHICASLHRDGERAAHRELAPIARRALYGGARGVIDADMARRLQ